MFQKSVNREYKSNQFKNLSASFTLWMETLNYGPHTVKLAKWNIDEFLSFLERQEVTTLHQFQNYHITQYLVYLQHRPNCIKTGSLSAGYINKHITALRWLSKYLQLSEKASFTIKPELLKTAEKAGYLTKEEIKVLYNKASSDDNHYSQRDTAMLSLFYGCGLRAGEGEALNIGDILFKKELVYVRKGKNYRERYVPMNKQVKRDLKAYLHGQRQELLNNGKQEALLLGRRGNRWKAHDMYQRLQWLKKRTGNEELKKKSFGLHILRHSIASHLLQSGMKLEFISRFLGHKSLETTQKYTHLAKEEGC